MKTPQLLALLKKHISGHDRAPDSEQVAISVGTVRSVIRHLDRPETVVKEGFGVEPDYSEPGY